jgi:hypothetical protein
VQLLEEKRLSVLAVLRDNGTLLGLLEKQAIVELMRRRYQPAEQPVAVS